MIQYSTPILKFGKMGDKTGWTYIVISASQASKLNKGSKVSFRVKGKLDHYTFEGHALLPMGEGNFILPINATHRKAIKKKEGDVIHVEMEYDSKKPKPSQQMIQCLKEDPSAFDYFKSLPPSHQNYYSKWIESAKTRETKFRRITQVVLAMSQKQSYAEMMKAYRNELRIL